MKFIDNRIVLMIGLTILCCLYSGCNSNSVVSGKVTFEDGTPLTIGRVQFTASTNDYQAFAELDKEGKYLLNEREGVSGIRSGSYDVTITGAVKQEYDSGKPPVTLIDRKFRNSDISGLKAVVEKGKPLVFDITVTKPPKK